MSGRAHSKHIVQQFKYRLVVNDDPSRFSVIRKLYMYLKHVNVNRLQIANQNQPYLVRRQRSL